MFEKFVERFYIRFGRLQLEGFHNKGSIHSAVNRSYNSATHSRKK
jgi:hypothetical protein